MLSLTLHRMVQALLFVALAMLVLVGGRPAPPTAEQVRPLAVVAQAVGWPPSTGLLVSEVVTGGASASDEFAEIYNASEADIDLGGLELVYVTASGSTVTRKQTWSQLIIPAHRHLLLANSAGAWAAVADGLYSGGFAATGGGLVLRTLDGVVLDSLSWGDAASSYVEGTSGQAPPTGSSLERRPGGAAGNATDTNDNHADTQVEQSPMAQSLSADPTPPLAAPIPSSTPTAGPSAAPTAPPTPPASPTPSTGQVCPDPTVTPTPTSTPTPTPTQTPGSTPTSTPTPEATPASTPTPESTPASTPTPEATPTSTPTPNPTPTPDPTPSPHLTPTPVPQPSPTPTPVPQASPTPTPQSTSLSIADARRLPIGTVVSVTGRLTTPTNLIDDGRTAFVEDSTAGIALALDDASWPYAPPGTDVVVRGAIESQFGQLTLALAGGGDFVIVGSGPLPEPLVVPTVLACEPFEGRLIGVQGWLVGAPLALPDGVQAIVDDGSGPLNVFIPTGAGIPSAELPLGSLLRLTGVLGQYDEIGNGQSGYRLVLRSPNDVVMITPPTTPTPTPIPTPTPTSTPTPTPTSPVVSIRTARQQPIGSKVTVRGIVTVVPGWILGANVTAIQDSTGGIFVKLPAAISGIMPGRLLEIEGPLVAPYGNLEIRPGAAGVKVLEMGTQPSPANLDLAQLHEGTEGMLARVSAAVNKIEASASGSLTLTVTDHSGDGRIFFHAPLGMDRDDFEIGQRLAITGLVGDRLGLYRLWPRSHSDVALIAGPPSSPPAPWPTASPGPGATTRPTPSSAPQDDRVITIAEALRRQGQTVTVQGTVTVRPGLLDSDSRRVTIQDGTAAILLRLPADLATQPGQRLRASGSVGTYYGAPQLTAREAQAIGQATVVATAVRSAPLSPGLEWRLVIMSGQVESVRRDGDAWRAELTMTGGSVPIVGLERSGVPSTAIVAGRGATITGIVKRAYPTASDQRLAIVARSAADIRLHAGGGDSRPNSDGSSGAGSSSSGDRPGSAPSGSSQAPAGAAGGAGDVALADLGTRVGEEVRVGGRVASRNGYLLTISDASGTAVVRLSGAAVVKAAQVSAGDLVNAVGIVTRDSTNGLEIVVSDPEAISVLGAAGLVQVRPTAAASPFAGAGASDMKAYVEPGTVAMSPPIEALAAAVAAALGLLIGGLLLRRQVAERLRSAILAMRRG